MLDTNSFRVEIRKKAALNKAVVPSRDAVHVNQPLTNILIATMQEDGAYFAEKVCTSTPVAKLSDLYYIHPKGLFFRDSMERRAPSAVAPELSLTQTTDSYSIQNYGLRIPLTEQQLSNQDNPLDLERSAIMALAAQVKINRDRRWAESFFKTGVWGTDVTGVTGTPTASQFKQWDQADSEPIKVITEALDTQHKNTGLRPNLLLLGREVLTALRNNPSVNGLLGDNQLRRITESDLARLIFGDETGQVRGKIVVADSVYESDKHALNVSNTANLTGFIAGKNALLMYSNPSAGLYETTACRTFERRISEQGVRPQQVSKYYVQERKTTYLEVDDYFDQKLIASDLGYFFSAAIA